MSNQASNSGEWRNLKSLKGGITSEWYHIININVILSFTNNFDNSINFLLRLWEESYRNTATYK